MAVKTYSNKSNARRAAIKAGVNLDNVTFVQSAEGWYWEAVEVHPVKMKVVGAEGLEPGLHTATIQSVRVVDGKVVMVAKANQAVAEAIAEVDTRAEDAALVAVSPKQVEVEPKQAPAGNGLKIERNREERNGIKRPSVGGKCRQVWDACDAQYNNGKGMIPMPKDIKAWAEANGHNSNNAVIELYQWRKFMGFRGR